jgi:hypothetical protein
MIIEFKASGINNTILNNNNQENITIENILFQLNELKNHIQKVNQLKEQIKTRNQIKKIIKEIENNNITMANNEKDMIYEYFTLIDYEMMNYLKLCDLSDQNYKKVKLLLQDIFSLLPDTSIDPKKKQNLLRKIDDKFASINELKTTQKYQELKNNPLFGDLLLADNDMNYNTSEDLVKEFFKGIIPQNYIDNNKVEEYINCCRFNMNKQLDSLKTLLNLSKEENSSFYNPLLNLSKEENSSFYNPLLNLSTKEAKFLSHKREKVTQICRKALPNPILLKITKERKKPLSNRNDKNK